jgi:hypothetical protein
MDRLRPYKEARRIVGGKLRYHNMTPGPPQLANIESGLTA